MCRRWALDGKVGFRVEGWAGGGVQRKICGFQEHAKEVEKVAYSATNYTQRCGCRAAAWVAQAQP